MAVAHSARSFKPSSFASIASTWSTVANRSWRRFTEGTEIPDTGLVCTYHKSGIVRMVFAHRNGAVATVYAATPGEEPSRAEVGKEVAAAWHVSADVAAALSGGGETHVVVAVNANHPLASKAPISPMPIQRWTASLQPELDDISQVQRELGRALGTAKPEP
jgi:hypothetical protein